MFKALNKYFTRTPEKVDLKNYRFWSINNAAGHFALAVHSLWLVLFLFLGVNEMFYFNFISIAVFVVMIAINRRGMHLTAALLGITEVCFHQVLAVKYIGWDSGFQYYILIVCIFPFMQARGKPIIKFGWSMLTLVSFLFIELTYRKATPDYIIDETVLDVLNISNISLAFIFVAFWGALFNIFAFRTEDELEQRTIDLVRQTKMAALGQTAAGLAHEVNTPLGAIKASVSESQHISGQNLMNMVQAMRQFEPEVISKLESYLAQHDKPKEFLSTKEERQKRKEIQNELISIGVEEPDVVATQLVRVGIYEVNEDLKALLAQSDGRMIMEFVYNILSHQRNLDTVLHAADKAARLVSAFKMYSSSQHIENAQTNLKESIENVLLIYQNMLKKGISVQKQLDPSIQVPLDPDKLNQIWTNLIHNAIHAMNNNGVLEISSERRNGVGVITFSDTGHGIPEEIREKIFEPFFTTKEAGEGTGLGLDIIKKIIEDHDGTIFLESEIGKGTTFRIELPLTN